MTLPKALRAHVDKMQDLAQRADGGDPAALRDLWVSAEASELALERASSARKLTGDDRPAVMLAAWFSSVFIAVRTNDRVALDALLGPPGGDAWAENLVRRDDENLARALMSLLRQKDGQRLADALEEAERGKLALALADARVKVGDQVTLGDSLAGQIFGVHHDTVRKCRTRLRNLGRELGEDFEELFPGEKQVMGWIWARIAAKGWAHGHNGPEGIQARDRLLSL